MSVQATALPWEVKRRVLIIVILLGLGVFCFYDGFVKLGKPVGEAVEYRPQSGQLGVSVKPEGELTVGDELVVLDDTGAELLRFEITDIFRPPATSPVRHVTASDDKSLFVLVPCEQPVDEGRALLVREKSFVWFNRIAAVLLILGAVGSIVRTVQVSRLVVRADDEGLTVGSRPTIPWERVDGVDTSRFEKKGLAWVMWHGEDGSSRTRRIDDRVLSNAKELVAEIRQRTGGEADEPQAAATDDAAPAERPAADDADKPE